ncbi:MAG: hypothetical protein GC152_14090 [Alphaproteobacteria bacterium]|nr:hypothetical protein [Alphaproteobacteria bacterium]
MADARAMFAARIETPLAAADLAAEAASQHEARQRAARIDKALAILAPRIVGAREGVHRALARCEVVSKLKERATAEIDREPDEAT